jgi:hypothetical protein|nr:MAG TPA: hypothetical protein [Caudoviricetes sp.]
MTSDELGKKWLLQKLYDDGWRYCACRYNGELYLTNTMPMVDMESGYINIYSCNKFEYANCLKSVFPKIKGNEVLNIAKELGFIDWSKVKVDTPILVSQNKVDWKPRYFARYTNGIVETWLCGCTSWSIDSANDTCIWKYAKLVGDSDE